MTTIIFLFLVFNIFSFSSQTIKAAFFCDDELKEIYVKEGDNENLIVGQSNIPTGGVGVPYYFDKLNATPGDLIKFKCYNRWSSTYGAGCFLLNDNCHCYDFNTNLRQNNSATSHLSVTLGGKSCSIDIPDSLGHKANTHYFYEHYIPLDASKISCKNNINLICLNGLNCYLNLSDYITADFDIKNVECSIPEYYNYFSLNNSQLVENQRFKIIDELRFNSEDTIKILVKFKFILNL